MKVVHPMVEKVARAMCDGNWDAVDFCQTPSGETPDEFRDYWIGKACVAIQALLEPDEDTVNAGKAAGAWADQYQHNAIVCTPRTAFRAMLSSLLEGE